MTVRTEARRERDDDAIPVRLYGLRRGTVTVCTTLCVLFAIFGVFVRWFGNTVLYAVLGGCGATALSALAGYGFARYRFRARNALFYLMMGVLLVPITAITLPLFLFYTKLGLDNDLCPLIVMGGLVTIVSLIALFLLLQRYWRGGLLLGGIAN